MRLTFKTATVVLALFAGVAIAAEATDPVAKARQELMDTQGANAKVLGEMAKGTTPFDAAAAEAAKAALIATSADIVVKFEAPATDPKSGAKPEIWTDFADFTAKAAALNAAATALDASTLEGIQAGMGDVGGACGSCHKAYKL